ncbi:Disks large-associated protein [Ooceraea biroi]|uniref:Disks large-associated protein n=1 Tax=Ooceraea biroi TaxID=2015173 RepID=A0A026WJL3_OOCBI|nr:Disks large-associated protein [Ooceraea biroi]
MPLKIESGTYTVNPVAKKNVSKFLLWKHWRRSVHEDRVDEDRRGGGEVAGLDDVDEPCVATVTSSVPGVGGIRSHRRTRPLSLAVQPLNYHRLDPEHRPVIGARHHPNMTSQESIGSCSLDVDRSASDRSENTVDSVSEKTLHSLNLSCNGEPVSSPQNLANGSSETLQKSHLTPDERKLNVSNAHRSSPEPEQLTTKKPSYLGLACSISGYSGITRYDSKLREGFRSRDSSPGARLITRDTSPAGFRSNENLNVPTPHHPPKSQSISPLAMDRQNGFTNGVKEECKVETYMESRSSISMISQGYSEVDKASLHTTFPDISPIRMSTPVKRSPGLSPMMSCGQQNKSFGTGFSSPKQGVANLSSTSFSDTSILNGSTVEVESQVLNTTSSSEKSFIQQRVERLYGPGALAQGFFFKRGVTRSNVSDSSFNKSSNDASTDNANTEESLKNLPVLRHLRPEFRAQLPVVSSRKPTDGTEQVIKPLQRVVPVTRKAEQKSPVPTSSQTSVTRIIPITMEGDTPKRDGNSKSIPDQQPAAPKVVLPVLEPSASSTNIAKQAQEAEKVVEEKDGHYFMKLLKQETDRLLSLAASAEAELASGDVALPEEAAGKLRSAAGKARLLASQKMQQFEGLCQKNINQVPGEEFPTTNEDLAGFWDMVMLQVVQVNELFDQIEKLRKSQWQEIVPDKKTASTSQQNGKRRVIPVHKAKPTANSEANKKAREAREQARRQMLEERRRAMRSNAQSADNPVEIFAPET